MNAYLLCALSLLSLAAVFISLRKFSGLYPWQICRSFHELLVLPFVVAYVLMLFGTGLLARCAVPWETRWQRGVSTRHSPTGSPRRRLRSWIPTSHF